MRLPPGTLLGPYRIVDALGAGGMGEVYRAEDTRLGREVAIKVLLEPARADAGLAARFEREARLLASLSHPNIATIHDVDLSGDVRFLVLELVEGKTLAERLAEGPLPVHDAIELGIAVAEALEAAHARGVVHRDLKPANVKITPDGMIKVLDFGIAKVVAMGPDTTDPSMLETSGPDVTRAGAFLGTPSYMSPEQARGGRTDARADLWAIGCLLYESMTGRKAFPGSTVVEVVAAVLDAKPDLASLPSDAPPGLRPLLASCLSADPALRPGSAEAVRRELQSFLRDVEGGGESAPAAPALAQFTSADALEGFPAWSPDGSEIVFSRDVGGIRKLFRKGLGDDAERQITHGAHDDTQAAWSRDGAFLLFVRGRDAGRKLEPRDVFGQFDDGDLWRLDLATGAETRVLDGAFNPSFSPEGVSVAVDASWAGPRRIWIVDASGRNPRQVTTDASEAVAHVRPRFSPNGTLVVFQNIERTQQHIRCAHVPTGRLSFVTTDLHASVHPAFSSSGRTVYFSSFRSSGGLNLWRAPVGADGAPAGAIRQVTSGPGQDVEAAISPDGKRIAFTILRQNADLWRLPLDPETGEARGKPEKVVATTREESRGSWSPDGSRIAFNSDRAGEMNLWLFDVTSGGTRQVTRGPGGDYQPSWSPDATKLAFFSSRTGVPAIWTVDLASGALERLTQDSAINVNPFFSPDGRSIAYQSDRGGRLEVWVMDADGTGARQLTDVGVLGHFLRWTKDGKHVVFRSPGGGTPLTLRAPREGGSPEPLGRVEGGAHMSFSPDESRILDVVGHKTLWVSPLRGGPPQPVFEFDDPDVRIDYPVWSPDGRWVLFDRFRPQGGDVFLLEGFD